MSATIDTVFRQRVLACSGFYAGKIDGDWGPKTNAADHAFHAAADDAKAKLGTFDPRTESFIATLLIKAQIKAREFMKVAGLECKIISGTRTYAEQDALFAQTNPRVTRARGGHSNHNFGIAWDVGIFRNGRYFDKKGDEQAYVDLAIKIKGSMSGIEWGGDWHSIVDRPHYNLLTGKSLDEIRTLFEAGKPFV